MLAGLQSGHRQGEVAGHRSDDDDGINTRIGDQRLHITRRFDCRIAILDQGATLGTQIAHTNDLALGNFDEVTHHIRSPIAIANYTHANHYFLLMYVPLEVYPA